MIELVVATTNQGKRREIAALVEPLGIKAVLAVDLGFIEEIEETGGTFIENARLKAHAVARALGRPALADDSGLAVEALGGGPGVKSARFAGENAGDHDNNIKLLKALAGLPREKRGAAFVCTMVCALPDGREITAAGRLEGEIATAPAGENGFGYDPLFIPRGRDCTVAQMSREDKNRISHRARALEELAGAIGPFLAGCKA